MTGVGIHGAPAGIHGVPATSDYKWRGRSKPYSAPHFRRRRSLLLLIHRCRVSSSTSSTMPRRLPTTCAKMTAEKWAQLRREAEAAESRVSAEVLAAEGTDVGYGILREGSVIVEMTGSEYLRQMHESNRAQSEAMAEELRSAHVDWLPPHPREL